MNNSPRHQRTLARTVRVEGFGYWSGRDVSVDFCPAPVNTGVVFVRTDLNGVAPIPASVQYRVDVPRRTSLARDGASVEMIEHAMAALAGMQIDNCEVRLDCPELPGCDGSSEPFVQALDEAGAVEQEALRPRLVVRRTLRVGDSRCWIEARPASATSDFSVQSCIDYGPRGPIGKQIFALDIRPETFRRELAPARTFVLEEEAEWLRGQGLGTRVTCSDLLVFGDHGPIENPLRFEDECVRHKALDFIGDLAMTGCDLVGHFSSHCSGHRLNAELVRVLLAEEGNVFALRHSA